jgi:predicted phage terminase large subunit-like protein
MEYYELKRVLKETVALHRADVVLIEDRASGTQLIQELNWENVRGVKACQPAGDKQMRLWAQAATMEQGFVHLPKEAPWLDTYLRELTSFPNARYDDQVDSTTQAIAWSAQPACPMQAMMDAARARGMFGRGGDSISGRQTLTDDYARNAPAITCARRPSSP